MLRFLILILIILPICAFGQKKEKVEVSTKILAADLAKTCTELFQGKLVFFFEPDFPKDTNFQGSNGAVDVTVNIDAKGNVSEVVSVNGTESFKKLSERAAKKAKFTPTLCDGQPIGFTAVFTYKFVNSNSVSSYVFPSNIKEFADLDEASPIFGSVASLTEKYGISFGYPGNKFYEQAPLTRGDFAQFLRMTLDYLFQKANDANKIPTQIGLMSEFNPFNVKSINSVAGIDKTMPFYRSVGILLQTYNIALVSEDLTFKGGDAILHNEVVEIWSKIFGDEAIPVNFTRISDPNLGFSRGRFALFLDESMQVLSYKVLP